MAKWGKVDYKQLKEFQKKLQQLNDKQQEFCEAAAKELAARLLAKVIRLTLPGQYPKGSGMSGGTLRRGWTSKSHEEAASGSGKPAASAGATYAQSLPIQKQGNAFVIDIINPVEYASYVEYGHRTRGGGGWVRGKFMMTVSVAELQKDAPKILEKKLAKWLGEALNGK